MEIVPLVLVCSIVLRPDLVNGAGVYSGAQLLKVQSNDTDLLKRLIQDDQLDVWSRRKRHIDILVPQQQLISVKRSLNESNIDYEVILKDVQGKINKEKRIITTRTGGRMNWMHYQRLKIIYNWLDRLEYKYPFVSVGILGTTVENRTIKYVNISSGKPNAKSVFIDGGIHAREWISPAAVTYIIRELVEHRDQLPKELLNLDFYIVPVLNPDGYEYTHKVDRLWRKNRSKDRGMDCYGVDLNRNFDHKWGGLGTSGDCFDQTHRGSGPASENEVQGVQNFALEAGNIEGYVSFHSYGQILLLPYGYDFEKYPPDFSELMAVAEEAIESIANATGSQYFAGSVTDIMYPAASSSIDWMKAKAGVKYTFGVELGDPVNGFFLPAKNIIQTSKEAWEIAKAVARAVARL